MFWIDVAIILFLASAIYIGYTRGLLSLVADLVGLALALVVASLFYRPLALWVGDSFRILPAMGAVISFTSIATLVQIIYMSIANILLRKFTLQALQSNANRFLGVGLNFLKNLVLIVLSLVVFNALPVEAKHKQPVVSAVIPKFILGRTVPLQQEFNARFGGDLKNAMRLFTIRTDSGETINLGFTTTRVKPRPDLEAQMLELVNQERTSRGLKALTANETARAVARMHSVDMFARGYFSHVNPDGEDPFDRMDKGGVQYLAAGENLALAPTLKQAHQGLMDSPGHRANILSADFGTVGIGIIDGGPYGLMVTQNFTN